jgi:hypothetical protein
MGLFSSSSNTNAEQMQLHAKMHGKNDILQKLMEILGVLDENNRLMLEKITKQTEDFGKLNDLLQLLDGVEMDHSLKLNIINETTEVMASSTEIIETFHPYQQLYTTLMSEVETLTKEVGEMLEEYKRKYQ